jgi:membrane-associated phospholipid phosphatase
MTARKAQLLGSAAAAALLYAALWVGFANNWHFIDVVDRAAIDATHGYALAHPGWVTFWNVFCTVLGPTAFRLFALAVIAYLLARRNVRAAVFLVVTVELSGVVTETAKRIADRPRPIQALVDAPSTSFPSGHALGVMVSVLALLTLALPVAHRRLRIALIAGGAAIVALIGIGRVVLNVHYQSDVLAGWALGYVWFVIGLLLVRPVVAVKEADETPAALGSSP